MINFDALERAERREKNRQMLDDEIMRQEVESEATYRKAMYADTLGSVQPMGEIEQALQHVTLAQEHVFRMTEEVRIKADDLLGPRPEVEGMDARGEDNGLDGGVNELHRRLARLEVGLGDLQGQINRFKAL